MVKKMIGQGDGFFKIGLYQTSENKISLRKNEKGFWNLSGRGLLIPGIRQVKLLDFLSLKEHF